MKKKEIKITSDGSHTIYLPELDETYHSVHGAIQEAKHVFIESGLNYFNDRERVNILEIGFGTGLNTYLTLLDSINSSKMINYTGIEAFPLFIETIEKLNYLSELDSSDKEREFFFNIHQAEWNQPNSINSNFMLTKIEAKIQEFNSDRKYDLIYFDAFGPRVQPEMWEKDILTKMYNVLNPSGILVTYCAKGSVKRGLRKVGFEVESLPGPPGKREMTRATKC